MVVVGAEVHNTNNQKNAISKVYDICVDAYNVSKNDFENK